MAWRKLGLVFSPLGEYPWMQSHAQLPTGLYLGNGRVRVYFASRDAHQRSHVCFVEIEIERPTEILKLCEQPVLAPGPLGCFDDHGVLPASLIEVDGSLYMYYVGWIPGEPPPLFYASIGVAVSHDGGQSFTRVSSAPVLSRSEYDPCSVTSPCVLKEGSDWKMWYVSNFRWDTDETGLQSFYDIKMARSKDGINWSRDGSTAIGLTPPERNIARPSVIRDADGYRMWYSVASGHGYALAYAESLDGEDWTRLHEGGGLLKSDDGFDSQAVAYPNVIRIGEKTFMFYNGNGFGRTGLGVAVEE